MSRRRNPLPEGTIAVGAGLLVNGLAAYGFLVVSARALGPARYASLSALWGLLFLLGPGLFLPVEQLVARELSRRPAGQPRRGVWRSAGVVALVLLVVPVAVSAAAHSFVVSRLFSGQPFLLVAVWIGLLSHGAEHIAKGDLSGTARFRSYGTLVGAEGLSRLVACLGLWLIGSRSASSYGIALALAPCPAIAVALWTRRSPPGPGPEGPSSGTWRALGSLLAASLLAQSLVYGGPLAAKLVAAPGEQAAAGRLFAGLALARAPALLFLAVQATLLPRLSGLAASGSVAAFWTSLRRVLRFVAGMAAISILAALVVGPPVLRTFFGPSFHLRRSDLALLAAASAAYLAALALAQALIALSGHGRAALGWLGGVCAFVAAMAVHGPLVRRIELSYLLGALAALVTMWVLLKRPLRTCG